MNEENPRHNPEHWESRYQEEVLPWDAGIVSCHLVELVAEYDLADGTAVEVGCGTGTNARWLCEHFDRVVATEVSETALEVARRGGVPKNLTLVEHNIIEMPLSEGPDVDFVFDRGVFHVFDEPLRSKFAERVASSLKVGGYWLSLCGSADGYWEGQGPPRLSLADIAEASELHFEIQVAKAIFFQDGDGDGPPGWAILRRKRTPKAD